jgi:hypothetical protein
MTKSKFNRLSARNKRVSVAQDVLLQLKAKKFLPKQGFYLELPSEVEYEEEDSAQNVLKEAPYCEVCAKGAMVCSYILNYNSATMEDTEEIDEYPEMIEIFGFELWNILEALFEGWAFEPNGETVPSNSWNVDEYRYNQNGQEYSLESLMENIVRNGGQYNYNGVLFGS